MAMNAKDLRIESALGAQTNDGSTKYAQGAVALQTNGNKTYHDIGANSLAKVDVPITRPCAIIGPDRVVPPQSTSDTYLKKASVEPWPSPDNIYQFPEYPHKPIDFPPSRNISPRQTFQENMQRIMVPPTYVSVKNSENRVLKNTKPSEAKYCDVPYTISPINIEPKIIKSVDGHIPNMNPTYPQPTPPQGWPSGNVNVRPLRPYGAPELYQYSEYPNYVGPRPISMIRPHRNIHEDMPPVYQDRFYPEANIRFKPYPPPKDRPHQQVRYDYISNYPNTLHLHNPYIPHKYDLQKSLPPQPCPAYPPNSIKYIDRRPMPNIERYQRSPNQQVNFNQTFNNQSIPSPYGIAPGNCLQNRAYPFSPDNATKPMMQNRLYFDNNNTHKFYPSSENVYMGDINRPQTLKNDGLYPSYPHMHTLPPHMYRKDNSLKGYEHATHLRNFEFPPNLNSVSRFPIQFSPQTISISPDSNTSYDTAQALNTQEDCGYVSQSSTASVKSIESGFNRISSDAYRRHETKFDTASLLKKPSQKNDNSKDKKDINVRQFLQMWNEGDDEGNDDNRETLIQKDLSNSLNHIEPVKNQDQLYVLGLVNVPNEELGKYDHIQKISKLPENIKGYNNIEILNQYEKLVESPGVNQFTVTPPPSKQKDFNGLKNSIERHTISMLPRPISPLDVEAKISQSVIHKEVGCNFEIRPCSPQMMNVDIATPVQNVLGERLIEKVINPVAPKSPMLHRKETNNISTSRSSPKIPSCKMVHNQYPSPNISDTVKTNYCLQDLESNSGVCFASLPRLDNDIELNFPEINQQFINANRLESVRMSSLQDLPILQTENVEKTNKAKSNIQGKQISEHLNSGSESDKDVSKLSKYRKQKRSSSLANESDVILNQNMPLPRTDSVIIKNPENGKSQEEYSQVAFIDNTSGSDEIIKTIKECVVGNTIENNCDDNMNNSVNQKSKINPAQDNNETAIDFSLNKNVEHGNNAVSILNEKSLINNDVENYMPTICEPEKNRKINPSPYLEQNLSSVEFNILPANSPLHVDLNRPMDDAFTSKEFSDNVLNDKIGFQSIDDDNLLHETVITHSKCKEVTIDKGSVIETATSQYNSNIFDDTENSTKCIQDDNNTINTSLNSDFQNPVVKYCLDGDSTVTELLPLDNKTLTNSPTLSHHIEDPVTCLKASVSNVDFNKVSLTKSFEKQPVNEILSDDMSPVTSHSLSSDTEDSRKCGKSSNSGVNQSDSPLNKDLEKHLSDNYMLENPVVADQSSLSVLPLQAIIPSENSIQLTYETDNSLLCAKSFNSDVSKTDFSLNEKFDKQVLNNYTTEDKIKADKLFVDAGPSEKAKPSEVSTKLSHTNENILIYMNSSNDDVSFSNPPLDMEKEELKQTIEEDAIDTNKLPLTTVSLEDLTDAHNNSPVISCDTNNSMNVKSLSPKINISEISCSNVIEHKVLNESIAGCPNYLHSKINENVTNSTETTLSSDIDAEIDFVSEKESNHITECKSHVNSTLPSKSINKVIKNYDVDVDIPILSKEPQICIDEKTDPATKEKENYTVTQEGNENKLEQDFSKKFTTKCENVAHFGLDAINTSKNSIIEIKSTDNISMHKFNFKTDDSIKDLNISSTANVNSPIAQNVDDTSDNNNIADKIETMDKESESESHIMNTTAVIEPLNVGYNGIQKVKKSYSPNMFFKKELFSPWFQKLLFNTDESCFLAHCGENRKSEVNSSNVIDFLPTDNANLNFSAKRFVKEDILDTNTERLYLDIKKSKEKLPYEIISKDNTVNIQIDTNSVNIEQLKTTFIDIQETMDLESFNGSNYFAASLNELSEKHSNKSTSVCENHTHLNVKSNEDATNKHTTEQILTKQLPSRRRRTLKRSLSESAVMEYNNVHSVKENNGNNLENKRTKFDLNNDSEILIPSQVITENLTSFIQNNRRNSISTIYNDENVSFCIVFDNDCVLTEESEENCQKVCYTEIPSDCLTAICTETETINSVLTEDTTCEDTKQCEVSNEFILQDMEHRTIEETWVEDVACMETVYSDDIAEDIIISAPTSPKSSESSEDETENIEFGYNNVNENVHTNKVMHIYGNQMCDNDAQLLEKLYRTPQMDVTKTLVDGESRPSVEYDRYYDNESLEEILSASCIAEAPSSLNNHSESPLISTPTVCRANNILSSASREDIQRSEEKIKDRLDRDIENENVLVDLPKINKMKLSRQDKKYYDEVKESSCDINFSEFSCDNLVSYNSEKEKLHYAVSSSPEVSSTTPEEKNSAILLKIRRYKGTKISEINEMGVNFNRTHDQRYNNSHYGLSASRPLITKAAQKYIPPLKETIHDLKVKLHLPKQSLYKLQQLKKSKEEPKIITSHTKHYNKSAIQENKKKIKPKFEDVLKSLDEIQIKMHREKNRKPKQSIPKVIIKKNENGAHYASTERKETFNPDLTGRKWQPWVFLEKSNFIDKMALKQKFKAIYSHRKKTYVLAESFRKYKSISNSKFVISHPNSCMSTDSTSTGKLKYTFKLKHN